VSISFLTCSEHPEGTVDDRLWADALRSHGEAVRFHSWEEGAPEDMTLFRSVWDYVPKRAQFLEFLNGLKGRAFNPVEVIRWNLDKRYLLDLVAAGVPTVPTSVGNEPPPKASEWVVKPAISASAYKTFRVDEKGLPGAIEEVRKDGLPLIQPFLREVVEQGEWSLLYFRGSGKPKFSHAVLKKPGSGDFRVQQEHGGSTERREPDAALEALSVSVLSYLERFDWLYLRLDAVVVDGRALVAELELFEPFLFFEYAPGSEDLAAKALLEKIKGA